MSLSVKKSALAVVACTALACVSSAVADTGTSQEAAGHVNSVTMHLLGSVSTSTCDIRPYTSAGADATTLHMGVVSKEASESSPVNFYLKTVNGCVNGISAESAAAINWDSNGLTTHGISNMYGTAKNVHIELSPQSGAGYATVASDSPVVANSTIHTGAQKVVYEKSTVFKVADEKPAVALPFKYSVKFASDDGKSFGSGGTIDTDISYTVAYL
ncbi:hypothetical protein CE665_24975 [Salmonella enterica subsp. enterica serovar Poona]|nr:hypothetical protein [Salmonella enterica]EBU1141603.1 hypothetical protein [Salmonella enterica]EDJ2557563.1 hypothetical protein [Salmonella enterica subsp. enterica serovar Poona]